MPREVKNKARGLKKGPSSTSCTESVLMNQLPHHCFRLFLKSRMLGAAQAKNIPLGGMLGEESAGMLQQYKIQIRPRHTSSMGAAGPWSRACLGLGSLGLALAAPTVSVGLGRIWRHIVCIVNAFLWIPPQTSYPEGCFWGRAGCLGQKTPNIPL